MSDCYDKKAIELVKKGKSLFITGKAGTGKTELLKRIYEDRDYGLSAR